jgi:hypothetical protein
MFRHAALVAIASATACASGASSSDAGADRADARPLPDSGPSRFDGSTGEPDGDVIAGATPVINEFVFNHTGSDTCELIEVHGEPSTSYAGYSLLVIEGDQTPNPGVVQRVFEVGSTDEGGLWVTAAQAQDTMQNGSSNILLVQDYTGGLMDLDGDNDGTLDSEPWAALADGVAVDDGTVGDSLYANTALSPDFDGADDTVGGASRIPDGADTDSPEDWVRNSFNGDGLPGDCDAAAAISGEALNTPGAPNTVQL